MKNCTKNRRPNFKVDNATGTRRIIAIQTPGQRPGGSGRRSGVSISAASFYITLRRYDRRYRRPESDRYVLLDASTAMHDMARDRLLGFDARIAYFTRDFRSENWTDGLRLFDAVVTMQSVHEVRHWRHVAKLYQQIMSIIVPGGYFLMADHYVTAENGRNPSLYFSRNEQRNTLINAGFVDVVLVIDRGDMALYRARRI